MLTDTLAVSRPVDRNACVFFSAQVATILTVTHAAVYLSRLANVARYAWVLKVVRVVLMWTDTLAVMPPHEVGRPARGNSALHMLRFPGPARLRPFVSMCIVLMSTDTLAVMLPQSYE